jgi:hypothetical protein
LKLLRVSAGALSGRLKKKRRRRALVRKVSKFRRELVTLFQRYS